MCTPHYPLYHPGSHFQTWCRCSVARRTNESTSTPQAVLPFYSPQTPLLPQPDSQASVSGCSLHPQTSGSVWHPHAGPISVPRERADAPHPRFCLTFESHFNNFHSSLQIEQMYLKCMVPCWWSMFFS